MNMNSTTGKIQHGEYIIRRGIDEWCIQRGDRFVGAVQCLAECEIIIARDQARIQALINRRPIQEDSIGPVQNIN